MHERARWPFVGRIGTALLGLVIVAAPASPAAAQGGGRIAIVAQDAELAVGLRAALVPWGATVLVVDALEPGASMPGSSARGRAIAGEHGADAVVWLSQSDEGWAVWAYDAHEDRAMARRLGSGPPFDEATAAAVALSIMTLLRHSRAAPLAERAVPPFEAQSARVAPPSEAAEPARELRVAVGAGLELAATSPDRAEGRFALEAALWPRGLAGAFGLGVSVATGTGIGVDGDGLSARLADVRVALVAHGRARLGELFVLGALAGAGLRVLLLDAAVAGQAPLGLVAVRGVGQLEAEVGLDLAPAVVVLRGGAAFSPWLHAYELDGVPVLATQAIWPTVSAALEIGF